MNTLSIQRPRRNLGRMQFVPGRKLRNRPVALNRLKRNLGLELR